MSKVDSYNSVVNHLKKTYYGKKVNFDDTRSIVDIKLDLDKYLMKSAFLRIHQNPLSITSVIGYMMSKIVEIKNIRAIVKAKHLGIESGYVEKNLLI